MKKIMKVIAKFLLVLCCVFLIGIISYSVVNAEEETETIEDNEVQEAIENAEEDKITKVIIEKASEVKEWIISIVVAFLGSGAFFGLIYAIVKKISERAKEKIKELEKEAKLSKEQAEQAKKCLLELTEKVETVYLPALEKSVVIIQDYLEIDKKKTEQVNELLEKIILPELDSISNEGSK